MKECPTCQMIVSDIAPVCPRCGTPSHQMTTDTGERGAYIEYDDGKLKCPRCGSPSVSIERYQKGAKFKAKSKIGFTGKLKVKATEKDSYEKRAICQNCGHDWKAEGILFHLLK